MAIKRKITNSRGVKAGYKGTGEEVQVAGVRNESELQPGKENLNPKRVVKNTFSYVAETPEDTKNFVNTVIGFILGYASKKAVELLSEEFIKQHCRKPC